MAESLNQKLDSMNLNGLTPAGAAYVQRVTHPPGEVPGYAGVPDASQSNVTHLRLVGESNHPPVIIRGASATTTTTTPCSSMLLIQTSGARTANYVFVGNGQNWTQPLSQPSNSSVPAISQLCDAASRTTTYNFSSWDRDVGPFRTTYKSSTYYLNATDFNNQGTVTTAKFKPSYVGTPNALSFLKNLEETDPAAVNQILEQLPDECFVDDPDYTIINPKTKKPEAGHAKRTIRNIAPFVLFQIWDTGARRTQVVRNQYDNMQTLFNWLPQNSGDIINMSPKAVSRLAKEGAFVVQQPADSTQSWSAQQSGLDDDLNDTGGLVQCFMRSRDIAGNHSYQALYSQSTPIGALGAAIDTPWNNLDWSMTLFEGLTTPQPGVTTLSSSSYITCKSYVGVEIDPSPASSLHSFMTQLPLPDSKAIEVATAIFHSRPDAMPAAANDFGSIAQAALKFIPGAARWLGQLFGAKPQQPKKSKQNNAPRNQRPANREGTRAPSRNRSGTARQSRPRERSQSRQRPQRSQSAGSSYMPRTIASQSENRQPQNNRRQQTRRPDNQSGRANLKQLQ